MTKISATTGMPIDVQVNGNLPAPGPVAAGNGYVYAASPPGSSPMVTQITTSPFTIQWMMCNTNGAYLFDDPHAMAVVGSILWVVNQGGTAAPGAVTGSVTGMDAANGYLLGNFS